MAAKKSKSLEVEFEFFKDTSGTKRYKEVEEDKDKQVVGSIYIKKPAAEKLGNPESLTVTIEAG